MSSKRGFTLVEVIIVLVMMAAIIGTAVLSVGSGVRTANQRNATRGVLQYIRHARAIALLKSRPVVVTFEEVNKDGSFAFTRLSLAYSQDGSSKSGIVEKGTVQTLTGETMELAVDTSEEGDALSVEPREFEGIRIRVEYKDVAEEKKKSISVFSNVDFLKKKAAEKKKVVVEEEEEKEKKSSGKEDDSSTLEALGEMSASVVYETNGRCDPYIVTIWKDGTDPDEGQRISVDRFGKIRVNFDEDDDR
jgi:prepilin-type N-terminal cleavage/methylation domain-containing protein